MGQFIWDNIFLQMAQLLWDGGSTFDIGDLNWFHVGPFLHPY